jgi:outer membrane receptor for ferrienterochelin and colicin
LHWSGFLQDEYSPIDKLVFTGGIRNDQYSITRQDWSWRGAVVYLPWKNHSFRGTVGRGYRSPNFFEGQLLINFDGVKDTWTKNIIEYVLEEGKIFGNPDLLNEKVTSYEVGYLGRIQDFLRYSLTLFHDDLEDSIEFNFLIEAPPRKSRATYFNLPSGTRIYENGGELAIDILPTRYLHGILSYSYVHSEAPDLYPYWKAERHMVTMGLIAQFSGLGVFK